MALLLVGPQPNRRRDHPPDPRVNWSLWGPVGLSLGLLGAAGPVGGAPGYGMIVAAVALASWRIERALGGPAAGGLHDHRQ